MEMLRRDFLLGAGAASIMVLNSKIGAFADDTKTIPWADQPPPVPEPAQGVIKNLNSWEVLDNWVTPTDKFFAIGHYNWPTIDANAWRLELSGLVGAPAKLSLADIKATMAEAAAINKKVVLSIYFRQPFVLDDASGLKEAGAIVAGFGVSDTALLDVVSGRFKPVGKLPFALARTLQAVIDNEPDVPGYPAADTLYPFGYGLSY